MVRTTVLRNLGLLNQFDLLGPYWFLEIEEWSEYFGLPRVPTTELQLLTVPDVLYIPVYVKPIDLTQDSGISHVQ